MSPVASPAQAQNEIAAKLQALAGDTFLPLSVRHLAAETAWNIVQTWIDRGSAFGSTSSIQQMDDPYKRKPDADAAH